ncbi:hypothetical protein C0993_003779 [Termitomyces sp. T159_Od127]|nr:hypothetical protein C0993_003779 [Termitomyces sp. T159_Od127]
MEKVTKFDSAVVFFKHLDIEQRQLIFSACAVIGCFVTRKGKPSSDKFIKWEKKADSFASRNDHIFLFSPRFIEIRNVASGVILQVIEGANIRLLHMGRPNEKPLVAMKGSKDDKDGTSEKIVELEETMELSIATPVSATPNAWDEWDM